MLQRDLPVRTHQGRVVQYGQPWHGLTVVGSLDYGGASPMTWTQPDSGDCWAVRVPGAPGEQASPVNPDHQWLDYALLSGWWSRQLYGQPLPVGRLSYVYTAGVGQTYIVNLTGLSLTDSNTKLGGDIVLSSTHVSRSPPAAITLTAAAHALGAAYAIWDIVAINSTGSQVVIGLWPASYLGETLTYTQSLNCRALARLVKSSHDYRVPPHKLLKLDLTATTATLATLKDPADLVSYVDDGLYTPPEYWPTWGVQSSSISYSYSGPSNECVRTTETKDYAWSPTTAGETSVGGPEYEKIVGCWYRDDDSLAYVVLRFEREFDWAYDQTGSGSGTRTQVYGTVWNGSACADPGSTDTGEPSHSLSAYGSGTMTYTWTLLAGGTELSRLEYVEDRERIDLDPFTQTPSSLTVDGTSLPANGLESGTAPGLSDQADLLAAYSYGGVLIHGQRYSNHAWGLTLLGLSTTIHGANKRAYLGGVGNVLDLSTGAALGYQDYTLMSQCLTARYASVQPDDATLDFGNSLRCWV